MKVFFSLKKHMCKGNSLNRITWPDKLCVNVHNRMLQETNAINEHCLPYWRVWKTFTYNTVSSCNCFVMHIITVLLGQMKLLFNRCYLKFIMRHNFNMHCLWVSSQTENHKDSGLRPWKHKPQLTILLQHLGFDSWQKQEFFFLPSWPDWFWSPINLLFRRL
jgi:hypothetical protein